MCSRIFAFDTYTHKKFSRQIVKIQHQLLKSPFLICPIDEFSSSYTPLKAHKSAHEGFLSEMHRVSLKLEEENLAYSFAETFQLNFKEPRNSVSQYGILASSCRSIIKWTDRFDSKPNFLNSIREKILFKNFWI